MNRNKVAVEFKVRSCLKVLFGFNFMGFSLSITSFKLPTFCISFLFMMRDHRMVALWLAEWPHTSRVEGKTPASGLCNFTQSAQEIFSGYQFPPTAQRYEDQVNCNYQIALYFVCVSSAMEGGTPSLCPKFSETLLRGSRPP